MHRRRDLNARREVLAWSNRAHQKYPQPLTCLLCRLQEHQHRKHRRRVPVKLHVGRPLQGSQEPEMRRLDYVEQEEKPWAEKECFELLGLFLGG